MEEQTGTLQLPTLGRLMCLGTLYDCRSHEVISPGVPLWDPETISKERKVCDQNGQKVTHMLSDSFNEKSQALEIDDSLKASILADLVDTTGSAEYLNDHWQSSSTCRHALHCNLTSSFEHLAIKQLESLKVQTPDVFTQGRATHVVTGILYGSNTFFVFDKTDKSSDSWKILNDLVSKFTYDSDDSELAHNVDANELSGVQCKVYCDVILDRPPTDYEGAVKLFTKLPEMLTKSAIPIKVFLYPLYKIDPRAARVCKVVSNDLLNQSQMLLEGLEHCFAKSNEMSADTLCTDFPQFAERFEFFKRMLHEYKVGFQKELARVLPSIQGGSDGESVLKEILQNANSSPFKPAKLGTWLNSKRKELSAVRLYVQFLPEVDIVKSRETLDDILMDPGIENVVCFTFRLVGQEEQYLTALSQYLATGKESSYNDRQWYDDGAVMKFMRLKARLFIEFVRSNPQSPRTKFIVTGFGDCTSAGQEAKVSGTVLLYEQGTLTLEDFEPPSQPGKPQCDVLNHSDIDLTWTSPKYGTANVQQYIIGWKRFRPNQSDAIHEEVCTEQAETSFSIKDLEPNESLEFQITAVSAVGISPASESSTKVRTLPASPPENLRAQPKSASSIELEWEQPTHLGKQVIISSYILRYGKVVNGVLQVMEQDISTGSPERRFTVRQLEPNTCYMFQVIALYDSGVTSLPSANSNICSTLPVSRPGKPDAYKVTSSSITIQWTAPALIGKGVNIRDYFIEYADAGQQNKPEWRKVLTNSMDLHFIVPGLMPNTTYIVCVVLVCEDNFMNPSEASDPFTTLPTGPPSNIVARQVSSTNIALTWEKPTSIGKQITIMHYQIEYLIGDADDMYNCNAIVKKTNDPTCSFTIGEAKPETAFVINVSAVCDGVDKLGDSNVVQFTTRRLLKNEIREHAKVLEACIPKEGKPCILQLPLDKMCQKPHSQSFSFGKRPQLGGEHKVIMVVGVTGSGKSTLINGMINHILDVERNDEFRFKIVDIKEGRGSSQAHSQTQDITSYTVYCNNYLNLPYTLTVIDTPGFGDTRGIGRDKAIIDQIREFFTDSKSHGVDHIDAIGFVVQASQPRLTQTQKYVFDSILSVFGKDISDNILLLVTFADSNRPPVLDAVAEADIPYTGNVLKFNNSALFAGISNNHKGHNKAGPRNFDDMFWEMWQQSMTDFLRKIQTLEAQSLELTKAVLEERQRLEIAVQGLQPQIQMGICKLEELRIEHEILEQHEAEIEANKDFKLEIEVPKCKKIEITGNFITNCSKCHFTCHYPCGIADDTKKAGCAAMNNGVCTVCPGKCAWDVHFNQQYKFEYYSEKEQRTYEEIEMRYKDATGKKMTVEQVIQKQKGEFDTVRRNVFALIAASRSSVVRLEEIALKPNPLSVVEYIDILIESEKQSAKPGWQKRMSSLHDVRKEADIMGKVKQGNYDPFENYKKVSISTKQSKKFSWFKFGW